MAISQNVGTTITALLPALFAAVAPPGVDQHPGDDRRHRLRHHLRSRPIAAWSARETYRVHMNDLGNPDAAPVPEGATTTGSRGEAIAAAQAA